MSSPNSTVSPAKSTTSGFPNTPGRTLSDSTLSNKDYSLVRNHWLNKFSNSSTDTRSKKPAVQNQPSSSLEPFSSPKRPFSSSNAETSSSKVATPNSNSLKRSSSELSNPVPAKVPKLSVDLTNSDPDLVECPICFKKFRNEELNDHLDQCLNGTKPCIVCDKNIPQSDYEEHVNDCCNQQFENNDTSSSNQQNNNNVAPSNVIKFEQCSVCDKPIEASEYPVHLNDCLQKMYQGFEDTYIKASVSKCPVCEKDVPESELTEHLENCRDLSDIFEDDGSLPTEDEESRENNCPVCSKLVNINEMNRHIDVCLNMTA